VTEKVKALFLDAPPTAGYGSVVLYL
jgi:hypothetical protein